MKQAAQKKSKDEQIRAYQEALEKSPHLNSSSKLEQLAGLHQKK